MFVVVDVKQDAQVRAGLSRRALHAPAPGRLALLLLLSINQARSRARKGWGCDEVVDSSGLVVLFLVEHVLAHAQALRYGFGLERVFPVVCGPQRCKGRDPLLVRTEVRELVDRAAVLVFTVASVGDRIRRERILVVSGGAEIFVHPRHGACQRRRARGGIAPVLEVVVVLVVVRQHTPHIVVLLLPLPLLLLVPLTPEPSPGPQQFFGSRWPRPYRRCLCLPTRAVA
mmetsp:Transcript_19010/g.36788  ORF Transcript_19010/g.36788 Transcript_19010/m.36788 type:complete len:228 (-) Transcript_19010:1562-2245(-)